MIIYPITYNHDYMINWKYTYTVLPVQYTCFPNFVVYYIIYIYHIIYTRNIYCLASIMIDEFHNFVKVMTSLK